MLDLLKKKFDEVRTFIDLSCRFFTNYGYDVDDPIIMNMMQRYLASTDDLLMINTLNIIMNREFMSSFRNNNQANNPLYLFDNNIVIGLVYEYVDVKNTSNAGTICRSFKDPMMNMSSIVGDIRNVSFTSNVIDILHTLYYQYHQHFNTDPYNIQDCGEIADLFNVILSPFLSFTTTSSSHQPSFRSLKIVNLTLKEILKVKIMINVYDNHNCYYKCTGFITRFNKDVDKEYLLLYIPNTNIPLFQHLYNNGNNNDSNVLTLSHFDDDDKNYHVLNMRHIYIKIKKIADYYHIIDSFNDDIRFYESMFDIPNDRISKVECNFKYEMHDNIRHSTKDDVIAKESLETYREQFFKM
jgi:hypothetical protein